MEEEKNPLKKYSFKDTEQEMWEQHIKYSPAYDRGTIEDISFFMENNQHKLPTLILGGFIFGNFNAPIAFLLYLILDCLIKVSHSCWEDGVWSRKKCFYIVDAISVLLIITYILIPPILSFFPR